MIIRYYLCIINVLLAEGPVRNENSHKVAKEIGENLEK